MKIYIAIIICLVVIIAILSFALLRRTKSADDGGSPLQQATIDGVYWAGTTPFPKGMNSMPMKDATVAFSIENFYADGKQRPVQEFMSQATPDFVLRSAGHPELHIHLSSGTLDSDWAHYEGVLGKMDPADGAKIVHGALYSISPVGDASRPVHWQIKQGLVTRAP